MKWLVGLIWREDGGGGIFGFKVEGSTIGFGEGIAAKRAVLKKKQMKNR